MGCLVSRTRCRVESPSVSGGPLGCGGSLLVSAAVTVVLLLLFGVIDLS